MRRLLKTVLAWIGGFTVLVVGGVVLLALFSEEETVPARTILEVDFSRRMTEYVPDHPLARIAESEVLVVRDVVEALERAAGDGRVLGLIARVGASSMGPAQMQEVRDAVLAFRNRGKPAIAFAETFGIAGPGTGAYYLATAFEEIYLQPSGDVGLTGLIAEVPFAREALDKFGVEPRVGRREQYKNAMNPLTERGFTGPHREATEQLVGSLFDQIADGIGRARGFSKEEVRDLVDRGPFPAQEALAANLVDSLGYRDGVYARFQARFRDDAKLLGVTDYLDRAGRPHSDGRGIALIYGVGPVMQGRSQYDPAMGDLTLGSDSVARAFRSAVEDASVRAILFRVDSPGGSYVASDVIWREVARAREKGKPVVVSMGDVAGSGGYLMAVSADKIVAQPGTLTGSIGVYSGKLVTTEFWENLGVVWENVHVGENATIWTGAKDFTPEQWAKFQAQLDRVYGEFTEKVAQGRNLSADRVLEVAKGRIWTGQEAWERGLVDTLGGFPAALRLAREAAGLAPDAPVHLKLFPRRKSVLEMVLEWDLERASSGVQVRALEAIRPLARLVRAPGILTMPPTGRIR